MNANRAGRAGEELRQSRLAAARRTPKDERAQLAGVGQFTKQLARRKQMPLTDKFLERARAHSVGQRRGLGPRLSLCVAKKIHGITLAQLAWIIHTGGAIGVIPRPGRLLKKTHLGVADRKAS